MFIASTFNQTGRVVEVVMLRVTYLTISLLISVLMNQYNRTVQLRRGRSWRRQILPPTFPQPLNRCPLLRVENLYNNGI